MGGPWHAPACRSTSGCCRPARRWRWTAPTTTSAARRIGGLALDTCLGDLQRDADGMARARLVTGGRAVTVWVDGAFRFIHIYTSDGGVAIEPMTCAPDAFNSGDGLLAIVPGGSFSGRWGLNTQREVQ